MKTLENKIKEITPICDKWVSDRPYGETYYYTFNNNKYCVSMCEQKIGVNTYVVSDDEEHILYMGFSEKLALDKVKELVNQWKMN